MAVHNQDLEKGKRRPMVVAAGSRPTVFDCSVGVVAPREAGIGMAEDQVVETVQRDEPNLVWEVGYLCLHRT